MIRKDPEKPDQKTSVFNVALAIVAGQVGFLTLVIVLAAVLGGLWLDNRFQTRPILTIALLIISIPISVLAMLIVVRGAVARIKAGGVQRKGNHSEEGPGVGTNQDS